MCIDTVQIWFGIANEQISSIFESVICPPHDNDRVLSFHIFYLMIIFMLFFSSGYHTQQQNEIGREQQLNNAGSTLSSPSPLTRGTPGSQSKYTPMHAVPSTDQQFVSNFQTSHNTNSHGIHQISLSQSSPQNMTSGRLSNVRHEPYRNKHHKKTSANLEQRRSGSNKHQQTGKMKLPTEPETQNIVSTNHNERIKIEQIDESGFVKPIISSETENQNQNTQLPSTPMTRLDNQGYISNQDLSNSSTSNINDGADENNSGVGIMGVKESGVSDSRGASSDLTNTDTDISVSDEISKTVKVEAITESELELEITGVEPGPMTISDGSWVTDAHSGVGYGQSGSRHSSSGAEVDPEVGE